MLELDGVRVMIDPYLSDSVAKVNPLNKRRVPVEEQFFDVRPDVLILTHDHPDHTDPETLDVIPRNFLNFLRNMVWNEFLKSWKGLHQECIENI